ncbi:hypothetical protein [Pseudanabaena yagii]|uniref:Uncharacterized protein n=1 Tax=Pseudanabaena yagii GIHE-NHR1 TaxID=2722753 RepID=A0ABX1LWQ7_9CYAN|nr:hypothetical protein [Pseudanabaena yagii]NMF59426.1 hypothetical protein [Pseudanabaena yagii GIHE-NHR1]
MSKFKRSALLGLICLFGVVLWGWIGFAQAPQPSIRLTTSPIASQMRPFEAEAIHPQNPVQLSLQALDSAGQALKNTQIHLQLLTPPATPWFTTDFPIVEGTTLLDMTAVAPVGKLEWQQMLPIRGNYQLQVEVTPTIPNSFAPIQQTLTLTVPESWVKYRNLGILVTILLAAGLVGGWIIGSGQPLKPGEIAPQRVRLLLNSAIVVAIAALLWVNISAELPPSQGAIVASAQTEHVHADHTHTEHSHTTSEPSAKQSAQWESQGLEMKLSGTKTTMVGQLTNLQVDLIDTKTQQPVTDVNLRIKAKPKEDEWVAFAYQGMPNSAGKFTWQEQFFDGAPHIVEVEVTPQVGSKRQFQSFQVTQTIDVEGVAPPLWIRLISLAYLTICVVVGLLLGLWLQWRRQANKRDWQRRFS